MLYVEYSHSKLFQNSVYAVFDESGKKVAEVGLDWKINVAGRRIEIKSAKGTYWTVSTAIVLTDDGRTIATNERPKDNPDARFIIRETESPARFFTYVKRRKPRTGGSKLYRWLGYLFPDYIYTVTTADGEQVGENFYGHRGNPTTVDIREDVDLVIQMYLLFCVLTGQTSS